MSKVYNVYQSRASKKCKPAEEIMNEDLLSLVELDRETRYEMITFLRLRYSKMVSQAKKRGENADLHAKVDSLLNFIDTLEKTDVAVL